MWGSSNANVIFYILLQHIETRNLELQSSTTNKIKIQEKRGLRTKTLSINYLASRGETANEVLLIHPNLQISDPQRTDPVGSNRLGGGSRVLRLRRRLLLLLLLLVVHLLRLLLLVLVRLLLLLLLRGLLLLLLIGHHPLLLLLLLVLKILVLLLWVEGLSHLRGHSVG